MKLQNQKNRLTNKLTKSGGLVKMHKQQKGVFKSYHFVTFNRLKFRSLFGRRLGGQGGLV